MLPDAHHWEAAVEHIQRYNQQHCSFIGKLDPKKTCIQLDSLIHFEIVHDKTRLKLITADNLEPDCIEHLTNHRLTTSMVHQIIAGILTPQIDAWNSICCWSPFFEAYVLNSAWTNDLLLQLGVWSFIVSLLLLFIGICDDGESIFIFIYTGFIMSILMSVMHYYCIRRPKEVIRERLEQLSPKSCEHAQIEWRFTSNDRTWMITWTTLEITIPLSLERCCHTLQQYTGTERARHCGLCGQRFPSVSINEHCCKTCGTQFDINSQCIYCIRCGTATNHNI